MSPDEARHILGAQGNVWTEYIPDFKQVEYMAFPRAFALAEVLWSPAPVRNFEGFQDRLALHLPKLDINYARHLFDIRYEVRDGAVALSNRQGQPMRYQFDGMGQAAAYQGPVAVSGSTRFRAWIENGVGRGIDLTFQPHAAFCKTVSWKEGPHPNYQLGGAQALSNGLFGNDRRYGDGEWLGWWGKDVELSVDLGKPQAIDTLQLRFFQSQGEWIYLPKEVQLFFSKNGTDFRPLISSPVAQTQERVQRVDLSFRKKKARYWKVVVKRFGIIPEGAQGAGHEAWVFLDEVVLR